MPIQNAQEAVNRLQQFWIFQGLTAGELLECVNVFVQEKQFPAGHTLFRQGDEPDFFYLLESGVVQEVGTDPAGGQVVLRRRAVSGDYIGRTSLMGRTARRATATVLQNARLLAISADDFHTMLNLLPPLKERLQRTAVVNRLLGIPLFSSFSEEQLLHLADLVHEVTYPAGQTIFRQGEAADYFYVIDTGQVKESATGLARGTQTWPKYLTAGNFFGRYSLLHGTPRRATAEALTDVNLFRIDRYHFEWLLQLNPRFGAALKRPDFLGFLRSIPAFSGLRDQECKQLAGYVGLAHFRPGDILYHQGETDPTLYILYEGEAIIRARDEQGRQRPRGYLQAGRAVGESALFLGEPRDVTLLSTTHTNWFYLTRPDLDLFLAEHPELRSRLTPRPEVRTRQQTQRFRWLDADEQIVFRQRRHWFVLVGRLTTPLLLLLLFLVPSIFRLPPPWQTWVRTASLVALALAGLWVIWRFLDWTNDYYIITTKRVAHREKVLLVRESRDETPLDKVQNVNIQQLLIGNLFGFGNLVIDTAAAAGVTRVTFDYVDNPARVQQLIFEQVSRVLAGERLETRRTIREKLEATVGASRRPLVPRPAIPTATLPAPAPARPGILKRLIRSTVWPLFWIENRTDNQITWRKHWIRLLNQIWLPALLLPGLLALLILYLNRADPKQPGIILLLLVASIPVSVWLWWNWSNWGNDLYAVTNDRLIDIEKLPLGFRSKRTETTFDKVQNVSYEIPHPIATLLNYGTVIIYTAGAEGRLDFEYVRDPKKVQAEIFRRLSAYQAAQRRRQREERWADLPEWFATFAEMRRS